MALIAAAVKEILIALFILGLMAGAAHHVIVSKRAELA